MLTINAPIFDIDGHETIEFPELPGLSNLTRRVNRTATLDGLAAINDFGYSDSDRTLDIRWTARSAVQAENVARMVKAYSRLIVSTSEGVFIGAPSAFATSNEEFQLTILVEKRIDQ